MDKKEAEFRKRLLATYKIEAGEHLSVISNGLLELEKTSGSQERDKLLESIFREVHSLKGASRAVNFEEIESICSLLESIFAAWRKKQAEPPQDAFDIIHRSLDHITKVLSSSGEEPEETGDEGMQVLEQLENLDQQGKGSGEKPAPEPGPEPEPEPPASGKIPPEKSPAPGSPEKPGTKSRAGTKIPPEKSPVTGPPEKPTTVPYSPDTSETVRISKAKLDSLLLQAEEMLSVKLKSGVHIDKLKEIHSSLVLFKQSFATEARGPGDNRDVNGRGAPQRQESYSANYAMIKELQQKVSGLIKSMQQDHRQIAGMVDNLLLNMRKDLMIPFRTLLELFPKLVRDLSHDQGKKVELEMSGTEIEIDRKILEGMKDPLIHLVRNCIDHGLEKPEERRSHNKPEAGRIILSVRQVPGNKVEIQISDDGKGIDYEKIKEKALKQEILTQKDLEGLPDQDARALIYQSGISTANMITDISGRGLGLAIVREKVGSLGGTVTVDSELNKGTSFRILLPSTLATYRGIFVRVSGKLFVIPEANIRRILRISKKEIKTVENKQVIPFDGGTVSFSRLDEVLEIRKSPEKEKSDSLQALILDDSENRIAIGVDEILYEQEVLVKNIDKPLVHVRNIAGATVLGSGTIVPILNVSDLAKSVVRGASGKAISAEAGAKEEIRPGSVIIAEDSITSRMLLKDILESEGFLVETAVDGADAFSKLREGEFDILVSDIDMPRMNGFELTAKVRADKKLAELPVVLVTALKSREDRERGMDAGANAYIEKGSFDPQQLLGIVRKLV